MIGLYFGILAAKQFVANYMDKPSMPMPRDTLKFPEMTGSERTLYNKFVSINLFCIFFWLTANFCRRNCSSTRSGSPAF